MILVWNAALSLQNFETLMCDDRSFSASRRAALGLFGASLVAGLGACAAPEEPVATGLSAAPGANEPAPPTVTSPATTPERPRPAFVPDYVLPPIQNGLAPVITRIPTKHPVVFLTIDDGAVKSPDSVHLLAEKNLPASLFLTSNTIRDNPGYFKAFMEQGSLVENHTVSHNVNMATQWGYQRQLEDIAGMQNFAVQQFGRAPTLFRPPGGAYSTVMRQAVAAAGLKAVITWEAKANAGRMDYQYGNTLRPGDIVLMHFRAEFPADFAAFRSAQLAAGLEVVLLEEFLGVR